ncbi:Transcription initiation factor IIB [Wickerhamomyces ciferrii]|uniref:Transcription initiation factor IIB n=1 Tax=Wickerhamomyces ciferrii (strain ATCC 14091 / BCRC 22168 / CBS 111 / JCM 3599 / NBRC 0793 / NRRL Y-1031 F-60-10) TaxID=1206466 RepID=K0KHC1_WICCF|nr:Transcription initiation factor IIB [Wickerhamomyces ciferrii]CCH41577.1 Transcription initiation factor IIB [Wickerhamomyces ciferrii]
MAAIATKREGPDLNIILSCPECKVFPPELAERFAEGDVVCALCGLVLSNKIVDTRSEWRTFSNDDQNGDDPSRVGEAGNPLLDGNQLSTMIGYGQGDSRAGRDLNKAQSKSIVDKKDNALQSAYAKISMMCDAAQLPRIVQDGAKQAYKLSHDEKALKGKSQESIMAAVIVVGCRKAQVDRTFKEICTLTRVPKKEIGRVFVIIKKILEQKNQTTTTYMAQENIQSSQTSAEDLIRRFCSHLGLSIQLSNAAEHIAKRCKDVGVLAGRSPITIAAAVIYMVVLIFKADLAPAKIAEKLGVSDGTIKTSYKFLYENKEELIDPNWIEQGKIKMEEIPKNG